MYELASHRAPWSEDKYDDIMTVFKLVSQGERPAITAAEEAACPSTWTSEMDAAWSQDPNKRLNDPEC